MLLPIKKSQKPTKKSQKPTKKSQKRTKKSQKRTKKSSKKTKLKKSVGGGYASVQDAYGIMGTSGRSYLPDMFDTTSNIIVGGENLLYPSSSNPVLTPNTDGISGY